MRLSTIEAKILTRLRRARGLYISRVDLAVSLYGDPAKVAALSSAVARLRRKGVEVETKRGSGYRIAVALQARIPAPIVVEMRRLPPTLAQMLGPTLASGARDLARRYALGRLARRVVALVAGPCSIAGTIEFTRTRSGTYELPPP